MENDYNNRIDIVQYKRTSLHIVADKGWFFCLKNKEIGYGIKCAGNNCRWRTANHVTADCGRDRVRSC